MNIYLVYIETIYDRLPAEKTLLGAFSSKEKALDYITKTCTGDPWQGHIEGERGFSRCCYTQFYFVEMGLK